jgi:hypothetical protein
MKYNSNNFVNYHSNTFTSKVKYNMDNWIAFDFEWEVASTENNINFLNNIFKNLDKNASEASKPPAVLKEQYNNIVTFGFEDSYGNSGCFDITDFNSQKSFLEAIKEKLLGYQYCIALGSKAIVKRKNGSEKLEGINGDLAILDSNFRNNAIPSIIRYNEFTAIPYVKNTVIGANRHFIADIDLLQVFTKPLVKNIFFKNKYKSLRLDEVGKALLGYGKLDNKTGAKLDEMSIYERKSYCLHDAHIVSELVRINNGQILKMMDVIASHTGLSFEEVCHKGMSSMWRKILNDAISKKISFIGYDGLSSALRKLYSNRTSFVGLNDNHYDFEDAEFEDDDEIAEYKENSYDQYIELIEQKYNEKDSSSIENYNNGLYLYHKEKQKDSRKYKGATVLSPQRGLHYDVYVFDVTSLYPTIIINHNISPETINCYCCRNNIKAREIFDQDYIKDCQFVPPKDNGYWICQRKKGLFSKILQDLTEQRIKYKKEGREIESLAIKAIINSGYGVFGHPHFKYYDPKVAEIITMFGRQTLSEMQKIANSLDLKVLYGDTDSLFVSNLKSKDEVAKFIDECKRKLKIDVSHEKTFRKLILVAKKHYIGILSDQDKEPLIKGMEGTKSDRPEFIQTVFREMINDIKNNINPIPKLRRAINELDSRQVPAEKLSISLTLSKNPQEYANDCLQKRLGTKNNLKKGYILVYYKCNKQAVVNNNLGKCQIKNVSESDNPADISYAKYKEMLVNSVKDVIEILGHDVEQDLMLKKRLADHYLSI